MKPTNRSGGPKTEEGKLIISRNAIKTGTYSSITVLPGEDAAEYAALEELLQKDFQPSDLAEAAMVRDLASLTWKKLRLERLEHAALIRLLENPPSAYSLQQHFRGELRETAMWVIEQFEHIDASWVDEAKALHKTALKLIAGDRATLDPGAVVAAHPEFCTVVERCADDFGLDSIDVAKCGHTIRLESGRTIDFCTYFLEQAIEEAEDVLWVDQNRNQLRDALRRYKEAKLLEFVLGDLGRRAHDDLSRAFYKALSELRKHQEWRRRLPIDVSPEA